MNNLIKRSTGLLRNQYRSSSSLFTQPLVTKRATFSTGSSFNNNNNNNNENNNENNNNDNENNNNNETISKLKRNLILTLAGVTIASAGLLYFEYLDNKDFMFSSNIPNVNKEHLDQFKKVMKDKHTNNSNDSNNNNNNNSNNEEEDQSDEAVVLTNPEGTLEESILIAYEKNRHNNNNNTEKEQESNNSNDDTHESTTPTTYGETLENDEINSEENFEQQAPSKEEDSNTTEQQQQTTQTSSYGENVENDEINSEEKDLDTITDPVELAEEIVNSIHIDDDNSEQQEQQEGQQQEELEPTEGIIIIAEPKNPIDEIIEALESKYINNITALISENVKLKDEIVKLGDAHHHFIIAMEQHLRDKYKETLDSTIDTVNEEVTKKLTEMEQYYKQLIQENYSLIQNSVEKQKENLVGIFNQQVESIKQSEYEKKVISKLASTLLLLQKVLVGKDSTMDKQSIQQTLQDTFNNLKDLSQHDHLIKNLLDNVSNSIPKDGVIDMSKLADQLKHVVQECRRISLLPDDQSMLGKAISNLAVKFILPSDAVIEGDDTEFILDAAEKYIKEGNLDEAINQISKISKKNSSYLKCTLPWLKSAKQRQEVENISKLLELKLQLLEKQQHIIDENKKQQQK